MVMREGEPVPEGVRGPGGDVEGAVADRDRLRGVRAQGNAVATDPKGAGWVIETVVNPFHCLYQDALHLHTQSRLAAVRSESEASRLARASLLLYVASAEAIAHQAMVELGRRELSALLADPARPITLIEAWRLLPTIVPEGPASPFQAESPPWPQFAELMALRTSWAYPGAAPERRAYYRSARRDGDYEPLQPHQVPNDLGVRSDRLNFPRTGLPRDPYALRPRHLDTVRGILDAAIEALDKRMGGALTRDQRHRREPVRLVHPTP
ncbi:MAG: hypothetical protein NVSMB9_29900 [Isosphaeraceae bacterium]